jgi:hypothetical protein
LNANVKIASWDREGLERVIRYCARPCFAGENLRLNGQWVIYRLSKPTHRGQSFIQLDPLEFLDKIAALIPQPYRHRCHYYGVFAPNAPLRNEVVSYANKRLDQPIAHHIQAVAEKAKRVSLDWATLIARIYEVNPLSCTICGSKIKIVGFVTHQAEIQRILKRLGWTNKSHAFDPPIDFPDRDLCQLIPGTVDGFPIEESQIHHWATIIDPPASENCHDPPRWEVNRDPPHWEDIRDPPHSEDNSDICQLVPGAVDGFPVEDTQIHHWDSPA